MRKIFLILFLISVTTTLSVIPVIAGTYGTIKGRVVAKETGEPIAGASVLVEGTRLGAYAKADGRFTITNITPSTYNLKVSGVGYAKFVLKNVKVSVDEITEVTIKLVEETKTTGTVEVIGDNKMFNKTDIGGTSKFDTKDLQNLARENITSIVGLSVGVFNDGNGFIIRGARPTESQIRVDGLDVGNQFTGGFGASGSAYYPMISSFATEQVQVLTGGFSAEYGDALGGIVNTIAKTGSVDHYEGYIRWRTDLSSLWGSQSTGIKLTRENNKFKVIETGPGLKLDGSDENKIEFGVGGPLGFLGKSTFYVSGSYFAEKYRNNNYAVLDPLGNNLGQLDNNRSWVKEVTGRLKFAVSNAIDFIVGGSLGQSNFELASMNWIYSNTQGINANGSNNGIPEYVAQIPVTNMDVNNIMVRVTHRLTEKSFYELTLSNTANNDVTSKRVGNSDPDLIKGFTLWTPSDVFQTQGPNLFKLIGTDGKPVGNKIIDNYESPSDIRFSEDKYLRGDISIINPLTGYIEGPAISSSTKNPWGLNNMFPYHGNEGGYEFRNGNYWQLDGNYNSSLEGGDQGFNHTLKTGFELRYYTQSRNMNSLPWDGRPFFDIYSSDYGGNLIAEGTLAKDRTSKPYHPYRGSFYAQDQISYKGIIISAGLRFDYFNSNTIYRTIDTVFVSVGDTTNFATVQGKFHISPRLNIAYPLTENSNLSISYGIYYKMPELQYLYDGFGADVPRGNAIYGDPNMDVQRNNAYQITYNNQLTEVWGISIAAYYRDIYNQVGMSFVPSVPFPFFKYTVNEFGNARGLEFTFRKNAVSRTDHWDLMLNYNLSYAVGTSADPGSNYMTNTDPFSGKKAYSFTEIPMPYDRRHRVNLVFDFFWRDNDGPSIAGVKPLENTNINLSGFFQTGLPYTKLDRGGRAVGDINSERQPDRWSLDLRLSKSFRLKDFFGEGAGNTMVQFFVDVFNILNMNDIAGFNARTGDPYDDGTTFEVKPGDFPGTYYKTANFGIAETFSSNQYDSFGNRLYSKYADFDNNGIVTQDEKFKSYMNLVENRIAFRGNFVQPRTVYFGMMFNF